jgi:K+-transporting ATPase ATPase C chain
MKKHLVTAVLMTIATTILFGIFYPLVVTALAQLLFPKQANGQLIRRGDQVIGSRLIAQPFTSARYFHPRPSAAGNGYDASSSGGSNLGPTSQKLENAIKERIAAYRAENGLSGTEPVPADAVTASGSGLDPEISLRNAELQIPRAAKVRGLSEDKVRELVQQNTDGRDLGVFGDPGVNVLQLNLALDGVGTPH